jgi:hypothetical protein
MATRAGWRKVEYAGAEEEELREAEGLRQCSSKPHLNAPSGGGYPEEDIARRCERWASRREALLRHEREVQAAKELEECTFQPNVDLPDSSARAAQAGYSAILPLHPLEPPTRPLHPRVSHRTPSYPLASLIGGTRGRHYRVGCRRHRGAPGAAERRTRDARRARPAQQVSGRLLVRSTQGGPQSLISDSPCGSVVYRVPYLYPTGARWGFGTFGGLYRICNMTLASRPPRVVPPIFLYTTK